MSEQIILACDDQGNFQEYIPKSVGHTGLGRRHLAITVLIHNSRGEVLLQKRKHQVFDNIWCFTADTHPLHLDDKDETIDEACARCLEREYNIQQKIEFKDYGTFNYFGKYNQYCENEYCHLIVGEYSGQFNLNPEAGYECKWLFKHDFLTDFTENPQKYAPWVPGAVEILKKENFF